MTAASESQKLVQVGKIELLDIVHPAIQLRLTKSLSDTTILYDGQTYFGREFTISRFELNSSDPLPRPILRIDNIERFLYNAVVSNNDLRGASVQYREVYETNLDNGTDPDTTQTIQNLTYFIRQRRLLHPEIVEFELATPLDFEQAITGVEITSRECKQTYHKPDPSAADTFTFGTCPYRGSSYFNRANESVSSYLDDACPQNDEGCNLRFPTGPRPILAASSIRRRR